MADVPVSTRRRAEADESTNNIRGYVAYMWICCQISWFYNL